MALYFESVVSILVLSWSLVAFFGIAFWGGILWRKCNAYGAWAGILVAFALWYLARFEWGWELAHQYALYIPGGFIALIAVSLLTPPQDKEKLDRFYTLLHTPVGQEHKLREAGIDVSLE